jgi:hypothetical protein
MSQHFDIGEFHQVMLSITCFGLNSTRNYSTVDTEPFVLFLLVSVSILNRGEKVWKKSCTELNGHIMSNEQYLHNVAIFEAISGKAANVWEL